jgi:hypothetical protein
LPTSLIGGREIPSRVVPYPSIIGIDREPMVAVALLRTQTILQRV